LKKGADKKKILHRYSVFTILLVIVGVAIIGRAGYMMSFQRQYWEDVAKRFVRNNIPIQPTRGNIISADGKLMASSLPEYRIYLDCTANQDPKKPENDTRRLLLKHLFEISDGLHRIFPDKSARDFRITIEKGIWKKSKSWLLYPKRISFMQLQEAKQLPVFDRPSRIGGFYQIVYNRRQKPFGSLASRTLGSLYADATKGAKNGIELSFDSILRGKEGKAHYQKVMNRFMNIVDVPPENGCDVISTIDVDMQDISEKALVDELKSINASSGVVVLMEVKTGNVKAIVNMTKDEKGEYQEMKNDAISNMMEPGSTFKTASIMVALEDGYITPDFMVDTGSGVRNMYGQKMRDWNWSTRGGWGPIDVTHVLMYSSNVGVSTIIDKFYHNNPQRYIDGLKRMSLDKPLHLQIKGEGIPNIKGPRERYFSKTTLPWMSIGYETQVPPLNILTFYNAVANNGVMVRPKFVSSIIRKGELIKEYSTEIINPKICSDRTLNQIHMILRRVVMDPHGLGKPAKSRHFSAAGKTGTAQVSQGSKGYIKGTQYLVSFCGYFPAENPKYSCIVSIQKAGLPASGGLMAGSVFGKIAEQVYAKDLRLPAIHAKDTVNSLIPQIMDGDWNETQQVLNTLKIQARPEFKGGLSHIWCKEDKTGNTIYIKQKNKISGVPSVIGMGAKDAVYLLANKGLKVSISGIGKVVSQSQQPGIRIVRGSRINLIMK
jgi:cell division protein FtsI (penicillin-binding protein 3)